MPSDKAFDAHALEVVNAFLAQDLLDQGFEVVTAAEVVVALGVERQKELLGCGDSTCLAEIRGATGADYLVHGELAGLEPETALSLTLAAARGQALSQVDEAVKSKGAEELLAAIERVVPRLVQPMRDSGTVQGLGAVAPTPPPCFGPVSTGGPG